MNSQERIAPVADQIRASANDAETNRRLPDALMARLIEAGLFAIYTPAQFGGTELPLPDALRIVEEVARCDGSTGWVVALGFGNSVFPSALPDESAAKVLRSGSSLMAGSPGFMVRAVAVDGGYRISGQWQFASGCANADWLNVAAPIFDGPAPRMGPYGMPQMVMAFLEPSTVEIVDTWHVTGLRGSGSHDLRAENLFVPTEMTGGFSMAGAQFVRDCPLARMPFMTLLAMVQAPPVCLGIARHVIEEFASLAASKERPPAPKLSEQVPAQVGIARATALVESASAYYYQTVQDVWDKTLREETLTLSDRAAVRMACITAAENTVAAVDLLQRLSGSTAVFQANVIERCWRDIHTAAQHAQVQDARWENTGRILLGLEPNDFIV